MNLVDVKPDALLEKNTYIGLPYIDLEKLNDPESWFERGHRLANGFGVTKNIELGWKLILRAARKGHPVALALCFTAGVETTRDDVKAVALLKESDARNHAVASFNLGVCYIQGVGVDRNFSEGAAKFKKAAEQGLPAAQFNFGNCYGSGIGVSRDYLEASRWFKRASLYRDDAVSALKTAVSRVLSELGIERLTKTRHARFGEYEALAFGVPKDEVQAKELSFQMALDLDLVSVATCVLEGNWFEKTQDNVNKAVAFLQECDTPEAKFRLALHYGTQSPEGQELIRHVKRLGYKPALEFPYPGHKGKPRDKVPVSFQAKMIRNIKEIASQIETLSYFERYIAHRDLVLEKLSKSPVPPEEIDELFKFVEKVKDTAELNALVGKLRFDHCPTLPEKVDEQKIDEAIRIFETWDHSFLDEAYNQIRKGALELVELTNSSMPDLYVIRDSVEVLSTKVKTLIAKSPISVIEEALPFALLKAKIVTEKAERWLSQARLSREIIDDRELLEMNVIEKVEKYLTTLTTIEELETKAFAMENQRRAPFPTKEEKEAVRCKIQILELANLKLLEDLKRASKYHSWIFDDPTFKNEDLRRSPYKIDVTYLYREKMTELFNASSIWSDGKEERLGRDETHDRIVLGLKNELGTHGGYEIVKVEQVVNPRLLKLYETVRASIIDVIRSRKVPHVRPECFREWQTEFGLIGKSPLESGNEVMLIHGCPVSVTDRIISEGFDHRTSIAQLRDNRIAYGYFGSGVYFAENASKADEYATSDGFGNHMAFVSRVLLGSPFVTTCDARTNPLMPVIPGKQNRLWALQRAPYEDDLSSDSLIHLCKRVSENSQSWPTKNTDFCIYDRYQAYPEFLVTYKRISTI